MPDKQTTWRPSQWCRITTSIPLGLGVWCGVLWCSEYYTAAVAVGATAMALDLWNYKTWIRK